MGISLKKITLNVTDNCNFNCVYCYQKDTKSNSKMSWDTCKKAVDFFLANSGKEISVDFSGGEPLLNFEIIEKAVEYINRRSKVLNKKKRYSIITNGSLVTENILEFFEKNNFDVQFSFDSLLQDEQRDKGSFKKGIELLDKLVKSKGLTLSLSPVFTAKTVNRIYDSLMFLKKKGVKDIAMGLDHTKRWNKPSRERLKKQLDMLKEEEVINYKKTGKVIFNIFSYKEKKGISGCGAGNPQFSVSPEGDLWGCSSFAHMNWAKVKREKRTGYLYGNISDLDKKDFGKKYREVLNNYKDFRTDNFYTAESRCFLCPYLEECNVCPAINRNSEKQNRSLYFIPEYICEIGKIIYDANRNFIKTLKKK